MGPMSPRRNVVSRDWGDKPKGHLVPPPFPEGLAALALSVPSTSMVCLGLGEVLAAPPFPNRVGKAGSEGGWQRAALSPC